MKGDSFLKDFRKVDHFMKEKDKVSIDLFLKKNNFSPSDLFHLYTFYKCYDGSCLVYFADADHFKEERDKVNRIEEIRRGASE